MRVQIVTYNLDGISEGDYLDVADQLADRFSALPGLQAKLWLEHPESNTYGAIYFWDDDESMQRFLQSDLFEGTNPEFSNLVAEDYGVLENLTRRTQPVLELLEDQVSVYTPPPLPSQGDEAAAPAAAPTAKKARAKRASAKKAGVSKRGAKAAGGDLSTASASTSPAKKVPGSRAGAKKSGVTKLSPVKATGKRAPAKRAPAKGAPAKKAGRALKF